MIPELTTINDIVAIKPDIPPERTPGGIYLPEVESLIHNEEQSGVREGNVIAAGPNCRTLKVGDRVMFHKSQCAPWDFSAPECETPEVVQFLHEHEVLALLDT